VAENPDEAVARSGDIGAAGQSASVAVSLIVVLVLSGTNETHRCSLPDEMDHIRGSQLMHNSPAMHLNGPRGTVKQVRYFPIRPALQNVGQHQAFRLRKDSTEVWAGRGAWSQKVIDRCTQLLHFGRLFQAVGGACSYRPDGSSDVASLNENKDRRLGQPLPRFGEHLKGACCIAVRVDHQEAAASVVEGIRTTLPCCKGLCRGTTLRHCLREQLLNRR
jgi:hypothetical protein